MTFSFNSISELMEYFYRYKRRILCYLLSHVKACCRPIVKLGLLQSLKEVSDRSKIEILLSTAEDAFRDPPPSTLVSQFGPLFDGFVALLVSSFDYSAAKALNDSAGASWLVFSTLMRKSFSSGIYSFVCAAYRTLTIPF
jgi:U3 small nucleolar RNA-associated protein 10